MTTPNEANENIGRSRRATRLACACASLFAIACGHASGTAPAVATHKGYPTNPSPAVTTTAPRPVMAQAPTPPPAVAQSSPSPPLPPDAYGDHGAPLATPKPAASSSPVPPQWTSERPLPLTSQGHLFTVRGVDRSDVLNVRAAPGPQSPVVGQIPPETTGIVGVGTRRRVGPGFWREVSYGELRGWVNDRFLVEEGDCDSPSTSDSGQPASQ